jgi:putative membrane protein
VEAAIMAGGRRSAGGDHDTRLRRAGSERIGEGRILCGVGSGTDAVGEESPERRVPDPGDLPTGREPDVRFTYANERTFLAWNRTALALIATGVAATQLLPKLQFEWGRRVLGLPLIALGAIVAAESLRQWRANQRAMRRGDPLPRSFMPLILTIGIVVVGVIAVILAAFGTK